MSAFITAIGTANPSNKISQYDVLAFMQKAHALDDEASKKLEALYRATGIKTRYSVLGDYSKTSDFSFFPNTSDLEPFPSTKARGDAYRKEAVSLSEAAIKNCLHTDFDLTSITHIVTVSCTGLFAPGLDIELVKSLGLNKTVQRTAINFMGCYAAFNALKVARAICHAEDAKVLIVCTELCSLHFQKENTEDNYLSNALFGDGSAAVLVESRPKKGLNLSIEKCHCDLLPNGHDDMAWLVGDYGYEMKLSAYVPDIIKAGAGEFVERLRNSLENQEFDYYAVHPGGKKILQVIEEVLEISRADNHFAYDILKNYGNMSSPTILFVLERLLKNLTEDDDNKQILSFAFGPGLTLESIVFGIQSHA